MNSFNFQENSKLYRASSIPFRVRLSRDTFLSHSRTTSHIELPRRLLSGGLNDFFFCKITDRRRNIAKKFLELEKGLKFLDNCKSNLYKVFGVFKIFFFFFYQDILPLLLKKVSWDFRYKERLLHVLYFSTSRPIMVANRFGREENPPKTFETTKIPIRHSLLNWNHSVVALGASVLYTAISRKVFAKTVHATIPKGNMGYD